MKKIIAAITLLFFLAFNPGHAHALVPLAVINPATVGVVVAAAGVLAAGTAYYAPAVYSAGQSAVNTAASTASTSLIATKAIAVGAESYLFGKAVQAEIGLQALADWAQSHTSDAPIISAAANASSSNGYRDPLAPGQIVDPGSGYGLRQITTDTVTEGSCLPGANCDMVMNLYNYGWNAAHTSYSTASIISTTTYPDGSQSSRFRRHLYNSVAAPAGAVPTNPQALDLPAFGAAIPAAGNPAVTPELQKAIAANPSQVNVPGLSAAEIGQAYDQAAALKMQSVADQLQAGAEANPDLTAAEIAAIEAQKEADLAALENAKELDKPEELPEVFTGPAVAAVTRGEIDLSPFYELQGLASSKFPFSLVASIQNFFNTLAGARQPPVIDWNYRNLIHFNISLAPADGLATTFRMILAFFFHAGILYAITRRWTH